jgi:cell division septum initiation protein DivIVA
LISAGALFERCSPRWPEEKREALEDKLPAYATEVASVSGGLLGFRSISREERAALQRVAREIAEAHAEAARTITERASVDTLPV